jgi:hypothetical protein
MVKIGKPLSQKMDTKYWGPSGWKLLHLIAEADTVQGRKINRQFWESLPYVLPCKFCRASLSDYYETHPIPTRSADMSKWLYTIHNCVNEKLKSQGQDLPANPPYEAVSTHYRELLGRGCTESVFPGWEFLFSIADNYPGTAPSKPMPDTPAAVVKAADAGRLSIAELNRHNLLGNTARIRILRHFMDSVPAVLPFPLWSALWRRHCKKDYSGRGLIKRTLWCIRCALDRALERKSEKTYHGLCVELAAKRSGCSASRRAKTCRAKPAHKRSKTHKH